MRVCVRTCACMYLYVYCLSAATQQVGLRVLEVCKVHVRVG
jgi:hypothetical protein